MNNTTKTALLRAASACEFIATELQETADCCDDLQQRHEILCEKQGALQCAREILKLANEG